MLEMKKLRRKKYNKNEAHTNFDAWLCVGCLLPNTSTTYGNKCSYMWGGVSANITIDQGNEITNVSYPSQFDEINLCKGNAISSFCCSLV